MALQAQAPDPSERIFVELRSKNDEIKNKAATELRDLITLLSRGSFYAESPRFRLTSSRMAPGTLQCILRQSNEPNQ